MDLKSLIKECRTLSKDTVKKYFWQDEEWAAWLSDAEKEASIRARLIRDSEEISIAAGDSVVDVPKGLFDIQYAELRAADGTAYVLPPSSHAELDGLRPGWRSKSSRPEEYIHNDKTLTLGYVADADYTLFIEFFREPKSPMVSESDSPEINEAHHIHLVEWALHKAYSKPDADTMNPGKSALSEEKFNSYFGRRPNADLRRRQNASRPHRNRTHL